MVPVSFPEENLLLECPPGIEGEPLNAAHVEVKGGLQAIVTCWKVTKDDLETIQKTGRIWLYVYGNATPPVFLTTEHPFQEDTKSVREN